MPKNDPTIKVNRFLGIKNTLPPDQMPVQEGSSWLVGGQNVDINDAGRVTRRQGYGSELGFGVVTAAYTKIDETRLFVVDGGDLKEVDSISPLLARTLKTGIGSGELHWCEAGNQIIFAGASTGMIDKGECLPFGIPSPQPPQMIPVAGTLPPGRYIATTVYRDAWGRQGGSRTVSEIELLEAGGIQFIFSTEAGFTTLLYVSTVNGDQLYLLAETASDSHIWTDGQPSSSAIDQAQLNAYPPPEGIEHVCFDESRVWAAQTSGDTSYIYRSKPFWYFLFDPFDAIPVTGKVNLLLSVGQAVIIGTDDGVYAYSDESGLTQLAEYGVVPGQPGLVVDGKAFIWTVRGLCVALPFQNISDETYSLPPGIRAAVGLNESRGRKMIIVATDTDGEANNAY